MICSALNKGPKVHSDTLKLNAATMYIHYCDANFQELKLQGMKIGVFSGLSQLPRGLDTYLTSKIGKKSSYDVGRLPANLKKKSTEEQDQWILGYNIFQTFDEVKKMVVNTLGPLYTTPLPSGHSKEGALLRLRMSLYKPLHEEHQRDLCVKEYQKKCKQQQLPTTINQKLKYLEEHMPKRLEKIGEFQMSWFPTGWLTFCLMGKPSERSDDLLNPSCVSGEEKLGRAIETVKDLAKTADKEVRRTAKKAISGDTNNNAKPTSIILELKTNEEESLASIAQMSSFSAKESMEQMLLRKIEFMIKRRATAPANQHEALDKLIQEAQDALFSFYKTEVPVQFSTLHG